MSNERRPGASLPAEKMGGGVPGTGADKPAWPASSETRQQRPERPREPPVTTRSPRPGEPEGWRAELEGVCRRLRRLAPDDRSVSLVEVPSLLREARELLAALEHSEVKERLFWVGLEPARLEELSWTVHAIETLESATEAALSIEARQARGEKQQALELRDELLSACQWNLRDEEAADALARITSSGCVDELVLDLRELARLVSRYAPAFERDRSFVAAQQSERAFELAERLLACVRRGQLRMNDEVWPDVDAARATQLQELSTLCDLAYERLGRLLREVRAAGRHAYRAEGERRRWFAEQEAPRRSLLNALAERV